MNGSDGHTCPTIFTKRNGRFAFRSRRDIAGTSFIITGNRIEGGWMTCSLGSEKRTSDGVRVLLNCSSRVMVGVLPCPCAFATPTPS